MYSENSFNAPKGGNAVLTSAIVLSGLWLTAAGFNAPKGGNAVLTHREIVVFLINGKIYVSMPRRAVMLF